MPSLDSLVKHDFERLAPSRSALESGYVFVPKGDVYVTRHCRELTNNAGELLYIVYNEKTQRSLGLRCPKYIVDVVTAKAKATAQERSRAVSIKDKKDTDKAREWLLRLFPRIPSEEMEKVLLHGFQKGSGRVGRTTMLEGDEKVTLAVVAHVRHSQTPYDSLLRDMEREQGRSVVVRQKAREAIRKRLEEVLRNWRAPTILEPRVNVGEHNSKPFHKSKSQHDKAYWHDQQKSKSKVIKMKENRVPKQVKRIRKPAVDVRSPRRAAQKARQMIRRMSE